jgi:3-dehydroquinate dehydratase/shikimate dehydrogenase
MICVSIGRTRHKMMVIEVEEAGKQGAELIELRLDFLTRAVDLKRLLQVKPCPYVATIRRQQDGGRWGKSEDERMMLLRQIIASNSFEWVDLETDIADKIPRFGKTKRIISYHNLKEMPKDLEDLHARMQEQEGDVVKLAVRLEHPKDNLRVLNLSRSAKKPTIAIGLGDMGVPSRILAAKFGAPFSYAAFNKERGLAPGILSFTEMKHVYRYDQISFTTDVYAVIGDPIAQSLSPITHNTAFQAMGMDAVYVPIRVPKSDLQETLRAFSAVPVRGYSVTLPHKEAVLELAQEQDELVNHIKAANTLVAQEEDKFISYNTDCQAALEALRMLMRELEIGSSFSGRNVLILGAGGASRSIAFGLHREGALVIVASRTFDKGLKVAEEIGCRAIDWNARNSVNAEIVINCTPIGMFPNIDELPIHVSALKPGLMVMDMVYNPETTMLVRQARERGCKVATGVEMFVRQAAQQFQLFTGQEAPLPEMRKAVKRAVSPITVRYDDEEPPEESSAGGGKEATE